MMQKSILGITINNATKLSYATQIARFAGRYRLRAPIGKRKKETLMGTAASDDKFVKLTRKEDEEKRISRERREAQERDQKQKMIKEMDILSDL